tara:strand:- start:25 stop:255 length:231 start_codon:yes stop_codon:yes gene_type:complete
LKLLTDDPRYSKDSYSSALLAKDINALMKHRQNVERINNFKKETNEINNLKNEIFEIKKTLNFIVDFITKDKNGDI